MFNGVEGSAGTQFFCENCFEVDDGKFSCSILLADGSTISDEFELVVASKNSFSFHMCSVV